MTFSSSRIIKAGIVSQSVGVKSFELPSMAADTNGKGKSPVFPDFYLNTSAEEALPEEECEEEQEDLKEKEKERIWQRYRKRQRQSCWKPGLRQRE